MRLANKLFLPLAVLAAVSAPLFAAEEGAGETIAIPLSDPSRPVVLEASLINGGLEVEGYDGSEVLVEASERPADEAEESRDGMVRIPDTGFGLTLSEKDNLVTITADWSRRPIDLSIRVPRRTSVRLRTVNNGDLHLRGVSGEHELANTNGSIHALEVSGSVVADTTNGPIEVTFVDMQFDQPMSFTTWNGDVDVTLPAGMRADLRLEAGQGDVYSDFEVDLLPVATRVRRDGGGDTFRVRLERAVEGTIGGGGAAFHFKTFNGDIYLRRAGG